MLMEQTSQEDRLSPDSRDFVTALATGLEVIQAFDHDHPRMTLTEVAAKTGMNRAKARRFLLTLHALGYVRKRQRQFELSPHVLRLGYAFLSANGYHSILQQTLEEITETLDESSSLGILDGDDVVYVARSAARHRLMAIALSVGTRLPAGYTSMGRVLVANLNEQERRSFLERVELKAHTPHSLVDRQALGERIEQVRRDQYCILDQELDLGLRSVAVPVHTRGGRLVGAMNVSTNANRITLEHIHQTILPTLQRKARELRDLLS
ncbi:IclR family transcriptional regulator [Halomonas shantousis]